MARQEVVIGATTFYLQTFAPRDALRIFGDLQKDLLPSLGGVLASVASEDGGDINPETLLAGIKSFSVSLDGKALDAWCDRLIDPERVTYEKNGKDARKLTKANMDDAFEDFAEILELLFHIIKLNFAGPLGRWLGLSGPGLKEKLGNQLESSNRNSSES
ncbi:phage tail assembly chaperone [Stenotrophomonas sp. BIO128-Bstrain]|uniref:phage tail assembly chaperone n=1 Tax=Stenotrophomonas sp. BIO128-Bstrain TaxID=3027225 RepID=UPI0024DED407|nr:hypothetical protein [Stenotrophomonas sp. BIO128-Bstrain]WIA62312.1 hypothetical protein POS15_03555 [Stenotrophomonas sp. BIO128-Bstrain]